MTRRALLLSLGFLLLMIPRSSGQAWPHYGADPGGTRYSPLDQINRENVKRLSVAWTYHTGDMSDGTIYPTRSAFECTPIVIDRVMYISTPFSRVIALDAESGKEIWSFDPKIEKKGPYSLFVNRGVSFWRRGEDKRIFLGTLDGRLFALSAADGKLVKTFGDNGVIDLRAGFAERYPDRHYGVTSPPLIYRDLVVTGSAVSDGEPQGPSGDVRAFDARTGKLVWRFHTVPQAGEPGNDTWETDSWKERGGTNVWSIMSCDEQRGIVYLPLTSPSPDRYGGERPR